MSKYEDIIGRLEKATMPSEELGVRVKCALLAPATAYVEQSKFNGAWCIYDGEWNGKPRLWEYRGVPNELRLSDPTASIDAALALVERRLPGFDWIIGRTNDGLTIHCQLGGPIMHFGATPALAVLVSLFRHLEQRPHHESNGKTHHPLPRDQPRQRRRSLGRRGGQPLV